MLKFVCKKWKNLIGDCNIIEYNKKRKFNDCGFVKNKYKMSSCISHNGYLEVLKWVRSTQNRCPWDKYTCSFASWYGHS